jgi:hypothetical protein
LWYCLLVSTWLCVQPIGWDWECTDVCGVCARPEFALPVPEQPSAWYAGMRIVCINVCCVWVAPCVRFQVHYPLSVGIECVNACMCTVGVAAHPLVHMAWCPYGLAGCVSARVRVSFPFSRAEFAVKQGRMSATACIQAAAYVLLLLRSLLVS